MHLMSHVCTEFFFVFIGLQRFFWEVVFYFYTYRYQLGAGFYAYGYV